MRGVRRGVSQNAGGEHSKPVFVDAAPFVKSAVCEDGFMPQAFVTWRNFWRSTAPVASNRLGAYLFALGASPVSTCVGP